MDFVSGSYSILLEGLFSPSHVVTSWSPEQGWPAATPVEASDLRWCRLVDWQERSGTVFLQFAPANLREESNQTDDGPTFYVTDAVGVCSVVRTSDQKVIVQKRRESQFRYPGWYHVCGGMLEPQGTHGHEVVNPFAWMQQELQEELSIAPAMIQRMRCLGLARDERQLRTELLFETTLHVPAESFATRWGPEHSALMVIEDRAETMGEFVSTHAARFVPTGLACLMLYGKRQYGLSWHAEVTARFLADMCN